MTQALTGRLGSTYSLPGRIVPGRDTFPPVEISSTVEAAFGVTPQSFIASSLSEPDVVALSTSEMEHAVSYMYVLMNSTWQESSTPVVNANVLSHPLIDLQATLDRQVTANVHAVNALDGIAAVDVDCMLMIATGDDVFILGPSNATIRNILSALAALSINASGAAQVYITLHSSDSTLLNTPLWTRLVSFLSAVEDSGIAISALCTLYVLKGTRSEVLLAILHDDETTFLLHVDSLEHVLAQMKASTRDTTIGRAQCGVLPRVQSAVNTRRLSEANVDMRNVVNVTSKVSVSLRGDS